MSAIFSNPNHINPLFLSHIDGFYRSHYLSFENHFNFVYAYRILSWNWPELSQSVSRQYTYNTSSSAQILFHECSIIFTYGKRKTYLTEFKLYNQLIPFKASSSFAFRLFNSIWTMIWKGECDGWRKASREDDDEAGKGGGGWRKICDEDENSKLGIHYTKRSSQKFSLYCLMILSVYCYYYVYLW